MDSQQQRKAATQHPLTKRGPVGPAPIGGRFIAHGGLTPSTFQPMPKPRRMTIPATAVAPLYSKQWKNTPKQAEEKVRLNNERQAKERPTGGSIAVRCSCEQCGQAFVSKGQRAEHLREALCPAQHTRQICRNCGIWCENRVAKNKHYRGCAKEGAD